MNTMLPFIYSDDAHKGLVILPGPRGTINEFLNDYSNIFPPNVVYKGVSPTNSSFDATITNNEYLSVTTSFSSGNIATHTFAIIETGMDISKMTLVASVRMLSPSNN
jgi:hypothetical protein